MDGAWRSLVAHFTGGEGVVGSNPIAPTNQTRRILWVLAGFAFSAFAPINMNVRGTTRLCPDFLGNIWAVCSHPIPLIAVGEVALRHLRFLLEGDR